MAFEAVTYAAAKGNAKTYTDSVISSIGKGMEYKGSVPTMADLPTNPTKGWLYTIVANGHEVVYDGTQWIDLNEGDIQIDDTSTSTSKVWSSSKINTSLDTKVTNPSGGSTGNVLKKTDSGVEWGESSDNTYKAIYNSTTFSEIKNQHLNGKAVCCSYSGTIYFTSSITNTYANFEAIHTEESGVVNLSKIYVDSNGWSGPTITTIERNSNKVDAWSTTVDDTHYPSEKLVKDSLDTKITAPNTGTTGQYLKKIDSGVEWAEIAANDNVYIAQFTATLDDSGITITSGPSISDLNSAFNAGKQILAKGTINNYGEIGYIYGVCNLNFGEGDDARYYFNTFEIRNLFPPYAIRTYISDNEQKWYVSEGTTFPTSGAVSGSYLMMGNDGNTEWVGAVDNIYIAECIEQSGTVTGPNFDEVDEAYNNGKILICRVQSRTDGRIYIGLCINAYDPTANAAAPAEFYFYTDFPASINTSKSCIFKLSYDSGWQKISRPFELQENKITSEDGWHISPRDDNYPSEKLVKDSLDEKITAPTSGNVGDFLKKTDSGVEWAAISGSSNTFVAIYGTTTAAEIAAALDAGKAVICEYEQDDIHCQMLLETESDSKYTFTETGISTYDDTTSVYGNGAALNKTTNAWEHVSGNGTIPNTYIKSASISDNIITFTDQNNGTTTFTGNTGTITGITMNGSSKGTSGVVDLGTVITSHQDISGKEDASNKVSKWSSSINDTNYPSEKLVKDSLDEKITAPSGGSTGNVLKKTDSGVEWGTVPSSVSITTATFTLTAAGWSSSSQTVTVTGVTASNIVVVCPAPASCLEYDTDKILFTAQAANSVTFTCTTTPTVDINMNAMIIEA